MNDPYATKAESEAVITTDTRSHSEKYLDQLLDMNGANEQGAEAYPILYKIALELVEGKHADVIGVYNGREGRRDWWSGGCWLNPNEAVAVITVEGEQ